MLNPAFAPVQMPASPAAAPAPAPPSQRPGAAPADDWDVMFESVIARLRRSAGAPGSLDGTLLECAAALQQLHATLAQERDSSEGMRRELLASRVALTASRLELLGPQAGVRRSRHLAQHDSLTELPNRGYFSAQLDFALATHDRSAAELAVLYIDLDGFKPINERHGHHTGDELLRIVAQRMSRSVRGGDLVCRIGGDEFGCLLAGAMGAEQLGHLACKLFDAVSAPLRIGALDLCVRPSIGIAVCPHDGQGATALLKHADAAMVRAKRGQTGYAFFDRQLDA